MYSMYYLVVVVVIIYIFWLLNVNNLSYVKSTIDNKYYLVNNLPNKQKAADYLATIVKRMDNLILNLEPSNKYFATLKAKFSSVQIMENPTTLPSKTMTSYSINKGEKIVFCIRNPTTLEFYDINTVMYVVLHEFSHVACPEIGHTPLFVEIFASLLKEAIKFGVYDDKNYKASPVEYCGITINERII